MKFWSRGEVLFLGLLAVAAAVDGLWLWRTLSAPRDFARGQAIGNIYFRQNRAERREEGQVLWDGLVQGAPVYDRDTIRTTKDSLATIVLDGESTSIEMAEETLIYIDFGKRGAGAAPAKIELQGSAYIAKASGSPTIQLSTRGGVVSVDAGSVAVQSQGAQTQVSVVEGSATVRTAEGSIALDASSRSAVSSEGSAPAAKAAVEALAPKKGLRLVCLGTDASVGFSWKLPAGAEGGRLVVSKNADLSAPAIDRAAEGESLLATLGAGTWYWQLSTADAESPVMRFSVERDSPPDPLKPAPGARVSGGEELVDFSWRPSANAAAYRFEIASDEAFANPVRDGASTFATRISVPALPQGTYYWRAVALYTAPGSAIKGAEFPGKVASFSVAAPRAAAPSLPATPLRVSKTASDSGKLLIAWEAVPGADAYEVTVSRDEAGRDVVLRERTEASYLKVAKPLEAGDYFVSVRSESDGKLSDPSAPRPLAVFAPEPMVALSPRPDASLDSSAVKLEFQWRDPNKGGRYRLEVAEDAAFKKVVAKAERSESAASLDAAEGLRGVLYWRATLLGDDGTAVAATSPVRFVFPRALAAPSRGRPEGGDRIDLIYESRVAFDWAPVTGATEYRLTLYRVGSGERIMVAEWTRRTPGLVMDSFAALALDDYAWDIVALRKDGDTVVASSPPETRYFSLVQSRALDAPDLGAEIEVFLE